MKKTSSTKKTSPKKNTVLVNFILDKSGSMTSVRDATISGYNEYIQTLKKDKKSDYELTLTLFDTDVVTILPAPISKISNLTLDFYRPTGMTALYDAVCSTIQGVKEKKGQKVLVVIMTDGLENASQEYTEKDMKKLIKDREKKGNWTFVYLGANQDAYAVAQKYGINQANTVSFNATARGMAASMGTVANNTTFYAASAGGSSANFFSRDDQDILGKTK